MGEILSFLVSSKIRLFLFVLLLYSGCNHTVRVTAASGMTMNRGSYPESWNLTHTMLVMPMNNFRIETGSYVSKVALMCPNKLGSVCLGVSGTINSVLGLN
ncbi:MAG: hypothetical protein IT291_05835 [Deltaproteobacteria bacterium]|nr:hypothetical protein [Deltaproteobacteria bacterium]